MFVDIYSDYRILLCGSKKTVDILFVNIRRFITCQDSSFAVRAAKPEEFRSNRARRKTVCGDVENSVFTRNVINYRYDFYTLSPEFFYSFINLSVEPDKNNIAA